nr:4Fe-4S binding protein [Proteus mirabilis]
MDDGNRQSTNEKSGKCNLCGECASACPTGALHIIEWKEITV